jgi:phage gpG-like protein
MARSPYRRRATSLDPVTITGIDEIERKLSIITSPAVRRDVINGIATRIVTKSKRRIRDEIDLQGNKWKPRSSKAPKSLQKKKMLRGLYKALIVQSKSNNHVTIGFKGFGKVVASLQQTGFKRRFNKPTNVNRTAKASTAQAQKLKALGYKKRDGKIPTLSWIRANLTAAQAGKIIIVLRGYPAKSTWEVIIPARSFLGITQEDRNEIDRFIRERITYFLNNSRIR